MQSISARFIAQNKLTFYNIQLLRKRVVKILPFKFLQTKVKYLTVLLSFITYLVNPTLVAADFLKVTTPANIYLETPFEINLEISLQPNSSYFVKARIGKEASSLRNAQTYSETKGVWLSDSVSWTSFPSFTTDANGHWVGKIKAQTSKNAEIGSNLLVIRTRSSSNALTDSPAYTINIEAGQKEEPKPAVVSPPVVQIGEPILNEFMPQPETGNKEWVEIKNKGKGAADLSGWKIDDEAGKSTPQILDQGSVIQPGGFLVVTLQSSKLNDLTDSVRLLKPDDSVVESYTYNETVRGQSWAKDTNGNWFLTTVVTPNAENYIPSVSTSNQTKPSSQKPVSNQVNSNPDENSTPKTPNKLPQVLATSEAKIATVSASFSKKSQANPFTTPLVILGTLLVLGSGVLVIKRKRKSGQSEISDQPL